MQNIRGSELPEPGIDYIKDDIIRDGILHVTIYHYLKTPLYYMYIFLQNLSTMNILDSIFYRTLFLQILPVPPSPTRDTHNHQL
jgi:hypothetical protein